MLDLDFVARELPGLARHRVLPSVEATMRSFLFAWLVAFCLVALIATAVSAYVARTIPATVAEDPRRQPTSYELNTAEAGPFLASDAVEVVGLRLPPDAGGDASRRRLLTTASVSYYSPQHWRVCFDGACWIAHGPG